MEALQKRFQSEVEKLQEIERDRQQKITQLKQLEEQLIENSAVRDEFQLLLGSPDAAASAFRVSFTVVTQCEAREQILMVFNSLTGVQAYWTGSRGSRGA